MLQLQTAKATADGNVKVAELDAKKAEHDTNSKVKVAEIDANCKVKVAEEETKKFVAAEETKKAIADAETKMFVATEETKKAAEEKMKAAIETGNINALMLGELTKVALVEKSPFAGKFVEAFLDLMSPKNLTDVMPPNRSRPVPTDSHLQCSVPSEAACVPLSKPVEKDGDVDEIHATDVSKFSQINGVCSVSKFKKVRNSQPLFYLVYGNTLDDTFEVQIHVKNNRKMHSRREPVARFVE
eukprot:scaffold1404_cov166-Amphora_coffeaeformis.AAC.12